jgi:hypothetical protein
MLKNYKIVRFLNRQCAAMLAAPIMGHDVLFTLFDVYSFGAFFHSNTEGFLWEELLLISCAAWFDTKRRHLPTWLAKLHTHRNLKRRSAANS